VLDERLRKPKLLGGKKKVRWYRLWFILCESGLHFYQDVRVSPSALPPPLTALTAHAHRTHRTRTHTTHS
jgi:hypothetical protein